MPAEHMLLQLPQLFVSVEVLTHCPLQAVIPVGQLVMQVEYGLVVDAFPHTWPVAQQTPLHATPLAQVLQAPAEQLEAAA